MRSDFWSLPYAARQAIRRGENAAHEANARAYTIRELRTENEQLRAKIAELEANSEAVSELMEALEAADKRLCELTPASGPDGPDWREAEEQEKTRIVVLQIRDALAKLGSRAP